jgi:hypothetical protein
MPLGARFPFGEQPTLQLAHERFVFAMGRDDEAEFLRQLKRLKQLAIVDAERSLVGEKDLERSHAAGGDFADRGLGRLVEARNAHVERVVAGAFSPFRQPQLKRLERIVAARRAAHFDERRRAADEGSAARRGVGILGERSHEREINVDVRVDEPREDELPVGVDHLGADGRGELRPNSGNRFAFNEHIADEVVAGGDDAAVLNQQGHATLQEQAVSFKPSALSHTGND